MEVISYTAARTHFKATMDKVCDDHTPIIISRQNERPVVMMSLDDYNAIEETAYLLRNPANAKRLAASLAQIEKGEYQPRKLIEE